MDTGQQTAKSPSLWVDGTKAAQLQAEYRNGVEGGQFTLLESVGGGVALADFDTDGDLDVFLSGGGSVVPGDPLRITGRPCLLFLNDGFRKFALAPSWLEALSSLPYTHGAFVADFNRDGFPDLLLTTYEGVRLLVNDGGHRLRDGTTLSGLATSNWTTAACWADIDRDGWPDVFVTGYAEWDGRAGEFCGDPEQKIRDVCPPQRYPAARQFLYRNNRDGTFTEVTERLGEGARGKGLGVVALDLNEDGWIDFYVANDQVANQLYWGSPDGRFQEAGVQAGVSGNEFGAPEGSMGVDAGDYDGDGKPDLWTTNYELEDNSLYRNQGAGLFSHATIAAGLGGQSRTFVGFGTGLVDLDLDGWLDLYVINGHVLYTTGRSPYLQPSFLLRNEPRGRGRRFRDVTRDWGGTWFTTPRAGRGAASGDLDQDGDPDLVVVEQNAPASVLWNPTQPKHWIGLELRGVESEPRAVGAIVESSFAGRTLVRHVRSGTGYLSQSDSRILLPVMPEGACDVRIRWLTGKSEWFRGLQRQSVNLVTEGRGEPEK